MYKGNEWVSYLSLTAFSDSGHVKWETEKVWKLIMTRTNGYVIETDYHLKTKLKEHTCRIPQYR